MKHTNWIAAGAVAAMLAAASPAVKAQDATTTTTTTTTTTMADNIPVIAPVAPVDYSILKNQDFTYTDLVQAKASGMTDSETATIAKIAEQTGQPFSQVRADLMNGATFTTLANMYNLNLSDLYNVDDEKTKIDNYKAAYETTGTYALKAMMMSGMSGDMSAGGMAPPMTSSSMTTTTTTTMAPMPAGDIVDVAMSTPQLSTLVKAIQAAGLVDTLKGAGPFTVFAPTNKAFSRLPKSQRNALMADPTALKNLLSYHVIAGAKIDAATAMSMTSPTSPATVEGGTLQVVTSNGKVHINDATVTKADIPASNGIIHIIDRVLMPSADAAGTMTAPATPAPTQ